MERRVAARSGALRRDRLKGSVEPARRAVLTLARYATLLLLASLACGCAARLSATPYAVQSEAGATGDLPPAAANMYRSDSRVHLLYREQLEHDESHMPLWLSWFDPAAYLGAPIGQRGVTAFASLTIESGDRVVGFYTSRIHLTEPYGMSSDHPHMELDRRAREAVRNDIDEQVRSDAALVRAQLAKSADISAPPPRR